MSDFELAKDKVLMGAERRSMVMSLGERRNTAYHEGGHALVAMLLPGADPVHKVTIIPRGMALGVTQQLPLDDRYTYSSDYLMTRLAMMFGGRVAEELVFDHMTTGAGDDIEKATDLARKMVCEWGMSKELGPMTFGRREEQVFLGRDIAHTKDYSEHTAIEIDREVRRMVDEAYHKARALADRSFAALARWWPSGCWKRKCSKARKSARWSRPIRKAVHCRLAPYASRSAAGPTVNREQAEEGRRRRAGARSGEPQAIAGLTLRINRTRKGRWHCQRPFLSHALRRRLTNGG